MKIKKKEQFNKSDFIYLYFLYFYLNYFVAIQNKNNISKN